MLEQAATCLDAICLNRGQHVWLQYAGTSRSMSGCNMLEQGARLCCILLQLAFFMGSLMLFLCYADKTKHFLALSATLLKNVKHCRQQALKKSLSTVSNITSKFLNAAGEIAKTFKCCCQ
jgi:hypothetical protein